MKHIVVGCLFLIVLLSLSVEAPLQSRAEQMEPNEFAQGVEYTLLMSRNDHVCNHMLALFNQDLAQFGTEKYDAHEEFRSIGWKKETITRMEGDRQVTDSVEAAHVDINNDGEKDLVFKYTGPMRGYDRDTLYIFPSLAPREKRWSLMEIAHSPGRISHGGYSLIQTPIAKKNKRVTVPPMASISRLDPFLFDGTTYVGMRPLYELATGPDPVVEFSKVYVIAKYREGKYGGGPDDPSEVETGKRDDTCYFKVRVVPYLPGGR